MMKNLFEHLETMIGYAKEIFQVLANVLSSCVLALLKHDFKILENQNQVNILLQVISFTCTNPEASKTTFQIVKLIMLDYPQIAITTENFGECVDILLLICTNDAGRNAKRRNSEG